MDDPARPNQLRARQYASVRPEEAVDGDDEEEEDVQLLRDQSRPPRRRRGSRLEPSTFVMLVIVGGVAGLLAYMYFVQIPNLSEMRQRSPWLDRFGGLYSPEPVVVGADLEGGAVASLSVAAPKDGDAAALAIYERGDPKWSTEMLTRDGTFVLRSRRLATDDENVLLAATREGNLVLGMGSEGYESEQWLRTFANRTGPGLTLVGAGAESGISFVDPRSARVVAALRASGDDGRAVLLSNVPGDDRPSPVAAFTPDGRMGVGIEPDDIVRASLFVKGEVAATSFSTVSDRRLKRDVRSLDRKEALAQVAAMRPVEYTWRHSGRRQLGFVAQELAALVPDAVRGGDDAAACEGPGDPGCAQVDPMAVIATLAAALSELEARCGG